MRAQEFIVEYKLKVTKNSDGVAINATADGKPLGHAEFFYDEEGRLDPQTVWVDERYHRQGIARDMYDHLKSLGYTIVRSWDQTPAGKGFWDKHRGEDARVWEGSNQTQLPGAIKQFLHSLTPSDVGVEKIGNYHVHFEGFTDDCKSSSDYCANPEAVYQEVFNDFVQREGGQQPIASGMIGDEDYPVLYSVFRVRSSKQVNEISDERLQDYLSRAGKRVDSRLERMARARQRLDKGYEIYHAEDPSRVVHKFEANTPQLAQRYYQDYIERYESDVDYDLRLRRSTGIMEFAPNPDRSDNDDVPDPIFVLANRWWNAAEKQPQIESVLNSMGWSIHQVESEDDAVQLQHRDGATYFISADDFDPDVFENFADGKVKGKSRPGRVKRSGASCAGPVTDLRAKAKKYGGERGKMYHWCANMKSGQKKNK